MIRIDTYFFVIITYIDYMNCYAILDNAHQRVLAYVDSVEEAMDGIDDLEKRCDTI